VSAAQVTRSIDAALAANPAVAQWVPCFAEGYCFPYPLGHVLTATDHTIRGDTFVTTGDWTRCKRFSSGDTPEDRYCEIVGIDLLLGYQEAAASGGQQGPFVQALADFMNYLRSAPAPSVFLDRAISLIRSCTSDSDIDVPARIRRCTEAEF
jgi:hypothetical protein